MLYLNVEPIAATVEISVIEPIQNVVFKFTLLRQKLWLVRIEPIQNVVFKFYRNSWNSRKSVD